MLLQRIPGSQVAVQQPLLTACSICIMTTHDFLSYPRKDAYPKFTTEQWNRDQFARPQFQQQLQQPTAPKVAWEIAIEKLATTTNARFEQTNQEIQNMHATMKNMEQQIGHITLQVSERAPGTFPSQTVPNPRGREECNAIRTLRSGKSYDNKHENYAGNSRAAELPKSKSDTFADSAISTDSRHPKIDPKIPQKLQNAFMSQPKKKLVDSEKVILTEQCSAVLLHKLPPKKKDPWSFTISCTIGNCDFCSALIDLGASVNLMPYSVFKRLGEGELKPTSNIIQLADRSITYPRRIIEDVIVKVDKLYLPADFMMLDMDEDLTTPIILGRPFLATARTLIDVEAGTLTFRVKDQTVVFRLFEASIHLGDKLECMHVDALDGLPSAEFMTRSLTDHLSIKPQNLIHDCISPKMLQQSVQHNVQLINIKKKNMTICQAAQILRKCSLVERCGC
ncbi:unnamed protein product [Malus baccata var. baccata]